MEQTLLYAVPVLRLEWAKGSLIEVSFKADTHSRQTTVGKDKTATLRPGNIVVVGNLLPQGDGVRAVIEATGATSRYLLLYPPDLNPIEKIFSKSEAFSRKAY